jgi:Sulfotransferase family
MRQASGVEAGAGVGGGAYSFADPVFVLCNGRSGSTLLRFVLDAHPDLACPPETNLPALCAQLATVWSLIEGAPLSANRGDEPPVIPDAAIAGVRATMDRMVGSYLARRGKRRYCDKSLGSARFADLLLRVYPDARFLCLHRHPMDMIASGLEACPFGLSGYGFEPYDATSPGNTVLALARCWADNAAEIMAVEDRFSDRCLRVRYEDLVTEPEQTAAGIFAFLDAAPAPGISATCFSAERERFGPGDHKIWHTSKISTDSIGRGWSIPATMIAPQVLTAINELAGKLGYLPVDGSWGTSGPPEDLRIQITDRDDMPIPQGNSHEISGPISEGEGQETDADSPARSQLLGWRLKDCLAHLDPVTAEGWGERAKETFVAIWVPKHARQPAEHWLVDLGARTVRLASRVAQEDSDWDVIGSADAWEQVITGTVNLSAAMRACTIRYCDQDDSHPFTADSRISVLSHLLGLATWQHNAIS